MSTILLIRLILLLVGALPAWPYSSRVGLLAKRRSRVNRVDCNSPRFERAPLNALCLRQ
jgi:hypothetical protein